MNQETDPSKFGAGQLSADITSGMSERDRRILLREMERKNRQQNGQVNNQHYGGPTLVEAQPDIFGQPQKASAKIEQSKRDQVWQQRMQQKMAEVPNQYPQQQQPLYKPFELPQAQAVELELPIFNKHQDVEFDFNRMQAPVSSNHNQIAREQAFQGVGGIRAPSPVRSSMTAQRLQQAKELDSSFNFDEREPKLAQPTLLAEKPPSHTKPMLSPALNKNKPMEGPGLLQVIGNSELDRARREDAKKMVQVEYNQYLANQQQRKVGNIYEGEGFSIGNHERPRSGWKRSDSASREDHSLMIAGMQQMSGLMHRGPAEDEKQRRLHENKAIALANQAMAAAKNQMKDAQQEIPVSQEQRRRQLVDQVFDEVLDSQRNAKPMPQPQAALPPRQWSAINKRQAEMQKLQNQQSAEDPFFKARLRQDEQKRIEQEKKREYAAILNQQMEAKKHQRDTQSQPATPSYQQAHAPAQLQFAQQRDFQQPAQQYQLPNAMPPAYQQAQPQHFSQAFVSAIQDVPEDLFQNQPRERPPVDPRIQSSKQDLARQQEEYRNELARQIQMKEELKRQDKPRTDFDQHHQQDLPKSIHDVGGPWSVPPSGQPGSRPRTDVTRVNEQVDPKKEQQRLRYQEELRQQMEEQKRRKEEAKKKDLETDMELERKLQHQRVVMADREREEILREGKRDPRELEDKPKRQVRRDQFQTSDENNADLTKHAEYSKFTQAEPASKFAAEPAINKFDLYGNVGVSSQFNPSFDPKPEPRMNLGEPAKQLLNPALKETRDLFAKPEPFPGFEPIRQTGMPEQQPRQTENYWVQQVQAQLQPAQQQLGKAYQDEWVMQQREQASKMFEDQQRMIQLYQQALEQILQYRNSYFEQAMAMRENILKEREQLLEYEKLKQQQVMEIKQLKAVQGQLDFMAQSASKMKAPILDKSVQSNLNDYINKQKESILTLSRSSANFAEVLQQNKQMFPDMHSQKQQIASKSGPFEMVVSSARVDIANKRPPPPLRSTSPQQFRGNDDAEDELQRRVNEIDHHINSSQEHGIYGATPIEDLEKSLSAESKLVRVPQNNLSAKAQRLQESNAVHAQPTQFEDLMATWNPHQAEAYVNSSIKNERPVSVSPQRVGRPFQGQSSEKQSSQERFQIGINGTPNNKVLGRFIGTSKSPLNSSMMPQTIQELPNENDEDKALQSQSNKITPLSLNQAEIRDQTRRPLNVSEARVFSDHDFNARESSADDRSPAKRPSDLHSNLKTIERMIDQHANPMGRSGFNEHRRQTMTGSSFYDKTLQNERIQQAHQQEEVQKQMMRIFGNTSQSYHNPSYEQAQTIQEEANSNTNFDQVFAVLNHQKSSTMIIRQSNDRLDLQRQKTENNDSQVKQSVQDDQQNEWDDPELVAAPVFPTYGDENSQELILQNNSSAANTMTEGQRQLQLRNIMSDDNEHGYMGGFGQVPDSAFNTMSPPEEYNRREDYSSDQIQAQNEAFEIVDETEQQSPMRGVAQAHTLSPKVQEEETSQSIPSSKKLYMDEITALIKKATSQTNMAVQAAELKQSKRTPFLSPNLLPHFNEANGADAFVEEKPRSAAKNNDQILADLDKIISNLEAQQKNMQTFGFQNRRMPASDYEDDKPETIQEDPEESVTQSTNRKWKTLKDARDAKRVQEEPETKTITFSSRRAPLDPKSAHRPKSGKSAKSRKSSTRQAAGEPSPQRVGKYAQMALQNTSQSPMRVGKYTNMALQNSPGANAISDNGSYSKSPSALKSPQRVGKYAQMALNNSNVNNAVNTSGVSGQSTRMGKFAMMALQNQRDLPDVDNISQKYSRALSGSRERQKSQDRINIVQQIEKDIDADLDKDNNENVVNNGQPILRPLSSVSKSSRYNYGTPQGGVLGGIAPEFRLEADSEVKQTRTQFRNTGNIGKDVQIYGNGKPMQVSQYFSDEEDQYEPRHPVYQIGDSGRTELTEQLHKVPGHSIRHE